MKKDYTLRTLRRRRRKMSPRVFFLIITMFLLMGIVYGVYEKFALVWVICGILTLIFIGLLSGTKE